MKFGESSAHQQLHYCLSLTLLVHSDRKFSMWSGLFYPCLIGFFVGPLSQIFNPSLSNGRIKAAWLIESRMSPVYPCFVGTDALLEKSTNLIPSKQKQKLMEMEKIGTLNGRRSWWSKFFASNEE